MGAEPFLGWLPRMINDFPNVFIIFCHNFRNSMKYSEFLKIKHIPEFIYEAEITQGLQTQTEIL